MPIGPILVTGASGNVGRCVVARAVASGHDVRALVRRPSTALSEQVEQVVGDLADTETLAAAAGGATAVVLVWPVGRVTPSEAAVRALASGGARVVYVSSVTVDDGRPTQDHPFTARHAQIERWVSEHARLWTVLRATSLAVNAFAWVDPIRRGDEVRLPVPGARRSCLHEDDLAACALAVLTEDGHDAKRYVVSGPAVLTEAEQLAVLGDVLGQPVRWLETGVEAARAEMLEGGADEALADSAIRRWLELVDEPEPVTGTVECLTGRPARPFRAWVDDHAARFVV